MPEGASNSDESTVNSLIADQLELQEDVYNKIASVRRVETSRDDQARLTLLTLETSEARRAIQRNAFKLKYFRLNDKKIVRPDLTPMEMDEDGKLNDELWAAATSR